MTQQTLQARAPGDNLLGVCAAIGDCTGIDPLWVRLAFVAATLAISLEMTVIAYCIAALAVQMARR